MGERYPCDYCDKLIDERTDDFVRADTLRGGGRVSGLYIHAHCYDEWRKINPKPSDD